MIKRNKKTLRKNRMIKALDANCRAEVVEVRDGNTCQRCGARDGEWISELQRYVKIQWCHVMTREYHILRWEPDNSFAGCDRCHVWFDQHKLLSYEWFRKTWPERWEHIQNVLRISTKTSEAWLREKYEEMMRDPPSVDLSQPIRDSDIPFA